jgi:hypothetical protein
MGTDNFNNLLRNVKKYALSNTGIFMMILYIIQYCAICSTAEFFSKYTLFTHFSILYIHVVENRPLLSYIES